MVGLIPIFAVEILLKLIGHGWRFFRDGWNVFDFVIVGIALMPSSGALSVLRSLRILRALRLISMVPSMRKVVQALITAIPGMSSVMALILLIFFVCAVIATKLYGASFPDWFGTLGASMYTLFQIMTLESWSMGIVRPVMDVHPLAWIFFLTFILSTSFAVLNLFIGIIVDAMQSQHSQEEDNLRDAQTEALRAELASVKATLAEIKELLKKPGS